MELSDRLKTVCRYVSGESAADVGCDHGKLAAYLIEQGIANKVYATDVSLDSIEKTERLKAKLGLPQIETILGDGLIPLANKEVESCIICGLGSITITEILLRDCDIAKNMQRFIFCPLKHVDLLRKFLAEHGYFMAEEDLVYENGRIYHIFVAEHGEWVNFDDVDRYVGRRLIEKQHPLLKGFLKKSITETKKSLKRINTHAQRNVELEKDELNRRLLAYERGLLLCV